MRKLLGSSHDHSAQRVRAVLSLSLAVLLFAPVGSPVLASDDDDERGVQIKEAAWESGDRELVVKGKGRRGSEVVISDAASGQVLATANVREDKWRVKIERPDAVPCRVHAAANGDSDERDVKDAPADCNRDGGGGPPPVAGQLRILAANDLGMHCADLDYQIFSILPPFNVLHAQVIERGTAGQAPRILDNTQVDVSYLATSSPDDPVAPGSINTTSANLGGFKTNFWDLNGATGNTLAFDTYARLYPFVEEFPAGNMVNDSVLRIVEPLPLDMGLPVPDLAELYPVAGESALVPFIQSMPGLGNMPQPFARYDRDLPFFVNFPFGSRLDEVNWFAADGVPIMPVDDAGRVNSYPLMRVQATDKTTGATLSSVDVVLPVASEADCQNCHVNPIDCQDERLPAELLSNSCNGSAVSPTQFSNSVFAVAEIDSAPGDTVEQQLLNAAKINILRLHDAKHGAAYFALTRNPDGSIAETATPCVTGAEAACLANSTPVQCSQCHYSPALDLAQVGPVDEPEQGASGRQQTRHITMSRAMHGHHGQFAGLFPAMPPPVDAAGNRRDPLLAEANLEENCYQCHPGKRTQCLRGAMFSGGIVCQDCHGEMAQVGEDFSAGLPENPFPAGADLTKRVPWANEPACQSCHIGDAVTVAQMDTSDFVVAGDGVRLLQSYRISDAMKASLPFIKSPDSRFAENQSVNTAGETVDVLYRLSKDGHAGIMCEGCHGSTHAIWPNANVAANDNVAARQIQGHSGTITECTACHAEGSLGLTLEGPHGMHPVGDRRWNTEHEELAEHNSDACRACHGRNGEGTVLSRMAQTRTLICDDKDLPACGNDERITLTKGTEVSCTACHENEL